jgi:hypothetical protein
MSAAMEVNQELDRGPRPVREDGSLLILALLAFAAGGISGFVGAVFRLVLDQSDRFRGAVIDWAHGKEIAGIALLIGVSAFATALAATVAIMRSQFARAPRHRSPRLKDRFAAEPSPRGDPSKPEAERLPHRR